MNHIGYLSVYKKEVWRFLKVYNQTLIAPIITSLLFLAIFMLAIGDKVSTIGTLPFGEFMAPGLITMVIIQNAFANSSSSLTMSKVLGHIVDFLIPPLSATELTLSISLAAATRGILVGILTALAIKIFIPFTIHHFLILILYIIITSLILGIIGLLCGIMSNSFDQMSAITSYVITPLSFLSGTFYSIKNLPPFWQEVSSYNPFFYMIDGIRYALTGYHDGNLIFGAIYLISIMIILMMISIWLIKIGFRLKS